MSLRTLVAIAETGSFSQAASHVGRTQSAVSLQIAKLEDRLGTQLLNRTSRKVTQTQDGEILVAYARRILSIADEAALALHAPEAEAPLRIGFADHLAPDHLHDLLARFKRAHPRLIFELTLGTGQFLRDAMDDGKLDVMVAGPASEPFSAEKHTVLMKEALVWVGDYKLCADQARAVPLILMHPACSYRRLATETLDNAGVPWVMVAEVNSILAARSAVKAGLGISPMSISGSGGMRRVDGTLPDLPETAMIAYRGTTAHPITDRFIDFLAETLSPVLMGA